MDNNYSLFFSLTFGFPGVNDYIEFFGAFCLFLLYSLVCLVLCN